MAALCVWSSAEHFRCLAVCALWTLLALALLCPQPFSGSVPTCGALGPTGALQLCAHCQFLSLASLESLLVRRRWPLHVGVLGKFVFAWILISITDCQPWQLTSMVSGRTLQHTFVFPSATTPFAWSRLWGLARWGHDPSVTGRSARHQNSQVGCRLCHADDGSLIHHFSACPCHIYVRDVWAQSCGLSLCEASAWASHPCGQHPADSEGSRPVRWASVQPVGVAHMVNVSYYFNVKSLMAVFEC